MVGTERKLKVLHIVSGDLWAGAEVQAFTLLSQLKPMCEVSVVLLNPGRLAEELGALGVQIFILDESKLSSFRILVRLRRLMINIKPDIVHTHRKKENILGGVANLLSVRAKCLRTSHGAPESAYKGLQHIQIALDGFVGRHLQQAIIAVSSELNAKLEKIFPASNIHVIHNGINVVALEAATHEADFLKDMPDYTHIGIIGRLEPVKRIDLFLGMIPILVSGFPDHKFRFHIIGDGKLKERFQEQAKKMEIEKLVHFHGHRDDIPACISSLDAVVMCSDHEGTPMTALEALALGTPLVAHKVGGLVDVLKEYPQLLVNDHSSEGYAQALRDLLKYSNGPVTLPDSYHASRNAQQTIALYNRLSMDQY